MIWQSWLSSVLLGGVRGGFCGGGIGLGGECVEDESSPCAFGPDLHGRGCHLPNLTNSSSAVWKVCGPTFFFVVDPEACCYRLQSRVKTPRSVVHSVGVGRGREFRWLLGEVWVTKHGTEWRHVVVGGVVACSRKVAAGLEFEGAGSNPRRSISPTSAE